MSRIYTPVSLENGKVIEPDDFNTSNSQLAEAINRNLDGHNLPCQSVSQAMVSNPTLDDSGDPFITTSCLLADYWNLWHDGGGPTTSLTTITLRTDGILNNWNSFYYTLSLTHGLKTLTMNEDGVLKGFAFIDWKKLYGYDSPGFTVRTGTESWVSFGIFIDGDLHSETGPLYSRRHTTEIPIVIPLPKGDHTVEFKYKASRSPYTSSANTQYDSVLTIYQYGFSLKHIKR